MAEMVGGSMTIDTARCLMATAQPQTGARSTGSALVLSEVGSGTVALARSAYAVPVIDRRVRHDLVVKVAEGPEDGAWEVTEAGVEVDFTSNQGGARHNLPPGTKLLFEPVIADIQREAIVQAPGFINGADPDFASGLRGGIVLYEQLGGDKVTLDIFRSRVGRFPAAILVWAGRQPADGTSIAQTRRETRVGTRSTLWKDMFTLTVFSSRDESDDVRREEGLRAVDDLCEWLTDKQAVDGVPFSNPSGVQILDVYRDTSLPKAFAQSFYAYGIRMSTMRALHQRDLRTYNDWLLTKLNVLKQPADGTGLPNQGPLPLVVDNLIDMTT